MDFICDTLDINQWMPSPKTTAGKVVSSTDTTHTRLTVIEVPKNLDFVSTPRFTLLNTRI